MKLTLRKQWKDRCKLRDESDKLYDEATKLCDEGAKLYAEARKLWDEAGKLWDEAILEVFGDIGREWKTSKAGKGYDCHLENGEVYVSTGFVEDDVENTTTHDPDPMTMAKDMQVTEEVNAEPFEKKVTLSDHPLFNTPSAKRKGGI